MGRIHTLPQPGANTTERRRPTAPARAADIALAVLGLVLSLPLMIVVAVVVRATSHGPVLHREPHDRGDGRRVQLLSFRTLVDGADTATHTRLRAVVGQQAEAPLTGPGRLLRRTRLDRLPRLFNLLAGHVSLFA